VCGGVVDRHMITSNSAADDPQVPNRRCDILVLIIFSKDASSSAAGSTLMSIIA
jgi:hypothetical protein